MVACFFDSQCTMRRAVKVTALHFPIRCMCIPAVGVGDGGREGKCSPLQKKKSGKYFSGNYHEAFGSFVIFGQMS